MRSSGGPQRSSFFINNTVKNFGDVLYLQINQ